MRPRRIASVSGKGGVGKTTVTIGLARALAKRGQRVGIVDLDIESSSLGDTLGLTHDRLVLTEKIEPVRVDGIWAVSLSLFPGEDWSDVPTLVDEERVFQLVRQFFQSVNWPELDYIIIDHPPGSGPELRGLIQNGVDALVLVTAAQKISEMPVRRLVRMAREEYHVPIIGIVANDPYNAAQPGKSAADGLSARYGLPILAAIKWDPAIARNMDAKTPFDIRRFLPAADAVLEFFKKAEQPLVPAGAPQ